jgi:hypothetical protein
MDCLIFITEEIKLFLSERYNQFPEKCVQSICIHLNDKIISENALIKLIFSHGQKMNGHKNEFKVTSHFYKCFNGFADHFDRFNLCHIDIKEDTILSYEEVAKFVRCIKHKTQCEYFDRTDNLLNN